MAWAETVTETLDFSSKGFTNAQVVAKCVSDNNVSVVFNKGTNSNDPKYYTDGTAVRV